MARPVAQYEKITPSEAKLVEFLSARNPLLCAACGLALPLVVYTAAYLVHRQITAIIPVQYAIFASLIFAGMVFRYVLIGIPAQGKTNIAAWISGTILGITILTVFSENDSFLQSNSLLATVILIALTAVCLLKLKSS